jgi:type VI secretion system protein VasJ
MLNRMLAALRGGDSQNVAVADVELSPLLEDVARPISDEAACGTDIGYDSDFLRLKEEIDKLNAVDTRVDQERAAELGRQLRANGGRAGGSTEQNADRTAPKAPVMDDDFVVSSARAILRDKSKDLRVASYLALGLVRRDGLAGVAEGATACAILVETYWDGLYPPLKRMTARKSAIEVGVRWILESIDGIAPTSADRPAIERAREAASSLTAAFASRDLPDLVLQLGVLDAKLAELTGRIPAPATAPATPPTSAVAIAPRANAEISAPSVNTTVMTTPQSLSQAAEMIVRAAGWFRQDDARRVVAYRVARSLRWDALAVEPPNQQGKTAIEAPPAARRDYLAALHQRGEWVDLLREGELSFSQPPFHFWLDLQRFLVDALTQLGAEYASARAAVLQELQLLVSRIPSLSSLQFADGKTRFADAPTAAWLEEMSKPKAAATQTSRESAPTKQASGNLAARFAEPRKRLNDGDLAGALSLLQRGASEDASHHDRFLRRLYTATLCIEGGQLSVARAILEELDADIDTHRLDRWDPPLAIDVWTRLYTCYATQVARAGRGADVQQVGRDMQRVFARICRVDTTRALAAAQEVGHPKS